MVVEIAFPNCQLHFGSPDSLVVGDSICCPRCYGAFPYAPAPPSSNKPSPPRAVREPPRAATEPWCYVWVYSIGDLICGLGVVLLLLTGHIMLVQNQGGWFLALGGVTALTTGPLYKLAVAAARDLRKLAQAGDR